MDEIIKWVQETISNPVLATALTVGISIFGWSIYRALLNVLFTSKNIDNIGNAVRSFLKRISDPKSKRETELKFAMIACDILVDTGFEHLLKQTYEDLLHNEKLKFID